MKRFYSFLICFLLLTFWSSSIFAQHVVKGKITDENTKEPIRFAYIYVNDKVIAQTDAFGNYEFSTFETEFNISFKYQTYGDVTRTLKILPEQKEVSLNITLRVEATTLGTAIVTATRYNTDSKKSTASLVVLDPKNFENKNATSLDKALGSVSGLVIADNEPQMRGGSGFSSGIGSRVMILLDEIPILRADAGRPAWNFIPMEDVEQIEVLKGASSVTYGSSAINGAINVRTAYPRAEPKTFISTFFGTYGKPKSKYRTPWLRANPVFYGVNFLHSRQIRKNFDLVFGGEYFHDQGYVGGPESIKDSRNRYQDTTRGRFEQRARFNFGTRYRFQKVKGLQTGLNGNFMFSRNNQSFFWYDADTNMYRAYPGSLIQFRDVMFYLDPYVRYITENKVSHVLNNRITYSNNKGDNDQSCMSVMVYNEYQYSQAYKKLWNLKLTAGVVNLYTHAFGQVFNGDNSTTEPSAMNAENLALYAQLEKKFLKKENLTLQAGGRWEYYQIDHKAENKPIFRVGANYEIPKTKTFIRTSWGQGYRYPSIGEKYIATMVGRYGFYPNPDLTSETSWSTELGVAQPMKLAEFKAILDIAYFYQEYNNYIEFAMGPWNPDDKAPLGNRLGFRYLNTGPARIQGLDVSFMGTGLIGRQVELILAMSYTYSKPQAKEPNSVYYTLGQTDYSYQSTSSDTTNYILKYRIQHLAKFDLDFLFWKKLGLGFGGTYYSQMNNVDRFFKVFDVDNPILTEEYLDEIVRPQGDLPFRGIYNYMEAHKNGAIAFDARISLQLNALRLSLIVKNLFNTEYVVRTMAAEAPRNFTLQLIYKIPTEKSKN